MTSFGVDEPGSYLGRFCVCSHDNNTQSAFFNRDAADSADLLNASGEALLAAVDATSTVMRAVFTNKAPALLEMREPSEEYLRQARVVTEAGGHEATHTCADEQVFPACWHGFMKRLQNLIG